MDAVQLTSWSLVLFGTATPPRYLADYLSSRSPTTMHTDKIVGSHNLYSNDTDHHSVNDAQPADRFTTHSGAEISTNAGTYTCVSVHLACLACLPCSICFVAVNSLYFLRVLETSYIMIYQIDLYQICSSCNPWMQIVDLIFVLQLFMGYCYGGQFWCQIVEIVLSHITTMMGALIAAMIRLHCPEI